MSLKKTAVLTAAILALMPAFSQGADSNQKTELETEKKTHYSYRISDITFKTRGRTKPEALERNLSLLPKEHVFKSEKAFIKYLDEVKQQIINKRMFSSVEYDFTTQEKEGVAEATVVYNTKDTHNILLLPKPSFDSNSGIEVKFKLKDNNFLGLMNDFNVDFNGQLGNEDYPDDYSKVTVGINFSYDYPFTFKNTKDEWSNSLSIDWEIGQEKPDFSISSGLTIGIPLWADHELDLTFEQSLTRDADYIEYDDELYFTEFAKLALPFVIGHIDNTTEITYTPSVSFSYDWDADGLNKENTDMIRTPVVSLEQNFAFSKIDWNHENNFKNGYYFSATQGFAVNFYDKKFSEQFMPSFKCEAKYFLGFKWIGFEADVNFYTGLNTTKKIGPWIRGARDNQKFKIRFGEPDVDSHNLALETHSALVFNFNMPVHIITTHWLDWSYAIFGAYDTKPKAVKVLAAVPHLLMKYMDFEMQWSPFFDVGLLENRLTHNTFFYKEGIYTCGLEVLIYPSKWRSFVVRGSIGLDVSDKILDGKKGFDSSWRKPSSPFEIYFGLGTHF
ncbi:MAG: hypothetical protein J6Z17_04800 [Treponema sp.]|nr:hypothetical protein [Treponema sp.]